MSAAFELAVATYILMRLQTFDLQRMPKQQWRLNIFATMEFVCAVCWLALVVQAVRAVIR